MHNLVYVLDALDAYKKKLVKKIEVKGFELHNLRGTDGFLYLSEILIDPQKPPRARIALEVNRKNGVMRESHIFEVGADLYLASGSGKMPSLEQYRNGFVIKDINGANGTVTFLNGEVLSVGEVSGDRTEKDIRRIQIRETILSHFEKEEKLFARGIKCLSLFFIDEVANYRQYDETGKELLGEYGQIFEQEYDSILKEYTCLEETPYIRYLKSISVHDTHKGYFSIDKKTNRAINSVEKRGVCDDISAYDLILKNKERLLSFEEPTRFIFSHSALREGWDNPNVFQICTLKQSNSEVNKRQEVGRGMRLCIDQNGERVDSTVTAAVHDVNVLTVIASDSYKTFVSELQSELKSTLYNRPTKATVDYFTGKTVGTPAGSYTFTQADAMDIFVYLRTNGYADRDGNILDAYREAQRTETFAPLSAELAPYAEDVHKLVQGIFDEKVLSEMVVPAGKTKITENDLNENFYKEEFQELWKRINHKYAYTVSYDSERLIRSAIEALDQKMYVTKLTYVRTVGSQTDTLDFAEGRSKTATLQTRRDPISTYDLIGKICQGTTLTRKTAAAILKGIQPATFKQFTDSGNPEEFISKASKIINEEKAKLSIEGITYNFAEGEQGIGIFRLGGPVTCDRVVKAERHITPYVVVDSDIERNFAEALERDEDKVCVYAKLPKDFKIPTPVGNYSPDWAIVFYENSVKHIYFMAETKGSEAHTDELEKAKIACARKLFAKLGCGVHYDVVSSYQDLMNAICL